MLRTTLMSGLVVTLATPCFAQGTYVSVSLLGDVLRTSHVESVGLDDSETGGEAIGFALRLGTEIGNNWGVEIGFDRPSEIENESNPRILPASTVTWSSFESLGPTLPTVIPSSFPTAFGYTLRTRLRNTTLSSAAWVRQEFSSNFSLVYVGGLAFHRTESETEFNFQPPIPLPIPIVRPTILPTISTMVTYSARPFVGVESRIGLTEHVHLVPGVRLHALEGAWLLRPSIGLGWNF